MALCITPTQIAILLRHAHWFFLGGLALFICGLITEPYLSMTGLLSVMGGACIVGLGRGLILRGIWLLSGLLLLLSVLIYVTLTYLHIWHLIAHPNDLFDFASLALATWLLATQSRFLLTITRVNWRCGPINDSIPQ
ncbi:MAG TPA: hypothetical protein VGQ99_21795 [Tepidisphaeraceae bacterium]|jgi:hypothetical protein|nr:hypothetical protein [Tepidisphaeraceae bacterium]